MKSKLFIAIAFSLVCACANAEKVALGPQTDEQCKKNIEKLIEEHKALSNPASPSSVADDSFVKNLKSIQQAKGSCAAYNEFLDNNN